MLPMNLKLGNLNSLKRLSQLGVLAAACLIATTALSDEYPPGCSKADGGQGNTSTSGINFAKSKAHVGDPVEVFPVLGMVNGACEALHATGEVYIASGLLVTFLNDVTLDPGLIYQCPTNTSPPCTPGPYIVTITPALVGAPVNSPGGTINGAPKTVRAVQYSVSEQVRTGDPEETLNKFDTASISIVTPCIQVFKTCNLPDGKACFRPDEPISFRGFVTNCGDITLTNVIAVDSRTGPLVLLDPVTGFPLNTANSNGPVTLPVGAYATFTNSYAPTLPEICAGIATNTVIVRGTDTSDTGGPRASVTNSSTALCPICVTNGIIVTKSCPQGPVNPGELLVFSGSVSNTGNLPLTNVIVVNNQPTNNTPVFGPTTLAPGQGVTFIGSYRVPADSCGPYTDTLTAQGTTICNILVTNTATAICPGTNTPSIIVKKSCPPGLIQPGQLLTITGTVTNNGNITLTNVVVTNSIAVLGTNRIVFGPITLAPGAGAVFSDSYTIPLDSCGPYPDTLNAFGADKCFGRIVSSSDTAFCPGTNSPSIVVTKQCPPGLVQPGQLLTITGSVTNTGNITLTNVTVTNSISALGTNRIIFGPVVLAPGAGAVFTDSYLVPLNSCGPYVDTVLAQGADKCFGRIVSSTNTQFCPGTNAPAIVVTKQCPPGLIQPGQLLTITGTVTNTGNITLTNVTVTNAIAVFGTNRLLVGPVTLLPGAGLSFTDSYVVPLDSCGPYPDTVTARGADKCFGRIVTSSNTQFCPGTNSPSISIVKNCPQNPVPPGGTMNISGIVSNSGNITLTNITVTNVIAAIGQSHFVLGPITLLPGATATFTDSYTVPLDSCGPYRDTVLARGADKCFGRIVTASDFKDCPGITTPRITVTKHCPPNPVPPGGIAVFSGTVSNAGNITLTNVIVLNNRPTNNTPVFGPITLAPGQFASFTGTELVPSNCCTYFDTLTAVGASVCTGSNVTATASATCPTITNPKLSITKNCPPLPVPLGQPLVYTGTVSNAGNIALINVMVVDNLPTNNTPVLGPITLAPGESANFTGNFIVPTNTCDTNIADTVAAKANDVCTQSNVTASATALCPIIPTPRLTLTKQCPPNPVAPGSLLVFSGVVSNAGNLTITNIMIVNDRPVPNTPVTGPITLVPGQSLNFGGSYLAPYDCCGPCVDTLTAKGQDICAGSNVTATASAACPRVTTPRIAVSRGCPPDQVVAGELVFFTGTVTNSGNATLNNVVVTDDQAGIVVDSLVLAPSESVDFFGMYIPTNCGPSIASGITAQATDVCTGVLVTNRFVTSCGVTCQSVQPVILFGETVVSNLFKFSFQTEASRSYTVEFTDALFPLTWQTNSVVPGDGGIKTISDSLSNTQRFYRVFTQ